MSVLTERCVAGITANEAHCRHLIAQSIGFVTALNPFIGYQKATRMAQQALVSRRSVTELALEEGLLSADELNDIFMPENMARPRRFERKGNAAP
jgi:aspartate ammonia-lyase